MNIRGGANWRNFTCAHCECWQLITNTKGDSDTQPQPNRGCFPHYNCTHTHCEYDSSLPANSVCPSLLQARLTHSTGAGVDRRSTFSSSTSALLSRSYIHGDGVEKRECNFCYKFHRLENIPISWQLALWQHTASICMGDTTWVIECVWHTSLSVEHDTSWFKQSVSRHWTLPWVSTSQTIALWSKYLPTSGLGLYGSRTVPLSMPLPQSWLTH